MSVNVANQSSRRIPVSNALGNSTRQLGWPHFWLLVITLAGLLGTLAFVLFVLPA